MTTKWAVDDQGNRQQYRSAVDDQGNVKWFPVENKLEPFSPIEMVKNIPGTTAQLAKDMAGAILNLPETGRAIKTMGKGAYQKYFVPGEQPEEYILDQVIQAQKDQYAKAPMPPDLFSTEKSLWQQARDLTDYELSGGFMKALERNPAGVLSDVSAAASLGGLGLSTLPGKAGLAGKQAAKVAAGLDPINMALNASKIGVKGLLKTKSFRDIPVEYLKSSAKFGTVLDKGLNNNRRDDLAKTMIKHQIPLTQEGIDKAGDLARNLNNQKKSIIRDYTKKGAKLSTKKIEKYAHSKIQDYAKPGVNTAAKKQAQLAQDTLDDWIDPMKGKNTMTPAEMEKMKTNFYQEVNYNTINTKAKNLPAIKTKKAMARGAKETLEELDPRIGKINKELGPLLDLSDPLRQSVARVQNRDLLGIGIPAKVFAGEALTGGVLPEGVGGLLGMALGSMDTPLNKANLALYLGSLQSSPISKLMTPNRVWPMLLRKSLIESQQAKDTIPATYYQKQD